MLSEQSLQRLRALKARGVEIRAAHRADMRAKAKAKAEARAKARWLARPRPDPWCRVAFAAAIGVYDTTVRDWIERGWLRSEPMPDGHGVRIPDDELAFVFGVDRSRVPDPPRPPYARAPRRDQHRSPVGERLRARAAVAQAAIEAEAEAEAAAEWQAGWAARAAEGLSAEVKAEIDAEIDDRVRRLLGAQGKAKVAKKVLA